MANGGGQIRAPHIPSDPPYRRVYISPLNSSLLQALLPPSVLPSAKNVSYHTLETFPEKNYGFVDLPAMDAEKVRRKLNGAIFKGTKVRVEDARPQRTSFNAADDDDATTNGGAHDGEGNLKRKRREEGVIAGIELPNGRKVQRGWTKSTSSVISSGMKKQKLQLQTSSYTTTSECLFRTTLPANVASSNAPPLIASTKARMGERRVKDMAGRETVVHEFSSTTKFSSFLRDNSMPKMGKVVSEFVDGKGWVDDEGNVIEAVKDIKKPTMRGSNASGTGSGPRSAGSNLVSRVGSNTERQEYPLKGSENDDDDDDDDVDDDDDGDDNDDSDSSGDNSSISSSHESDESEGGDAGNSEDKHLALENRYLPSEKLTPITPLPTSAGSVPSLSLTIPTTTTSPVSAASVPNLSIQIPTKPSQKELHPLEAVFKHPSTVDPSIVKSSIEPTTPFTFFEPDEDDAGSSPSSAQHTPFSRKDFFQRGIRSAAPTPDTAVPWKRTSLWPKDDDGLTPPPLLPLLPSQQQQQQQQEDEEVVPNEIKDATTTPAPTQAKRPVSSSSSSRGGGPGGGQNESEESDWDALPVRSDLASLPRDDKVAERKGGFEELFYQSRGDANRAWKKRRREMAKEKRRRENRKGGEKKRAL
ncbi:hypothetical protein GP486_002630 [Trichoglossum hirsutum]|uniref:RRM domain-containing protein n=1 Tax=Trichoglossum hirsutum TaxID=265104 RepID=A0A9P8RRH2_9PEZI|nr:hypothetical protein GP486_002630 [Trichoglossum hirsutum]